MEPGPSFRSLVFVATLLPVSAQAYETFGFKWGSHTAGEGARITWGLARDGSACRIEGCARSGLSHLPKLPGDYRSQVDRAFDAWSAVADIDFVFKTKGSPDILIGALDIDGRGDILADSNTRYWLDEPLGRAIESDIRFDTADIDGLGDRLFNVLAHEIGHSLGLHHVDNKDALMYKFVSTRFRGPQKDDIAGVRYLYGSRSGSHNRGLAPIPLPTTFWMLLCGLLLLGSAALQRHRVPQPSTGHPRCCAA